MRRALLFVLAAWIAWGGIHATGQPASPTVPHEKKPSSYAPGEVLIKFKAFAAPTARASARAQFGASWLRTFASGAEQWRLGRGIGVEKAVEALSRNPNVAYAHPNYTIVLYDVPDDSLFDDQWNHLNTGQTGGVSGADVDSDAAWEFSHGCGADTPGCAREIRVAIIDTGIAQHPDLDDNVDRSLSYDFADHDSNADPTCEALIGERGHGTHVAGIVGAVADNGIGVAGVNWHVTMMALKIFHVTSESQATFVSTAVEAIDYAVAHGADVINASWGLGSGCSAPCAPTLYDAIEEAGEAGVVFVAASGNDANDNDSDPRYPASYDLDNVIAVATTTSSDALGGLSNYGLTTVDLGAPGAAILSTLPPDLIECEPNDPACEDGICRPFGPEGPVYLLGDYEYDTRSGTSMAAPHVAGAAALLRAVDPDISVADIKSILLGSTDPLPTLQSKTVSGGRLNVGCAMATQDEDTDDDGRGDDCDNCPTVSNPAQNFVGNPSVAVTAPNGGEGWTIASQRTITWTASDTCGGVSSVDILLSRNGSGGTYSAIATGISNSGSYAWTVTGPSSTNAFVKVVARDPAPNIGYDVSNAAFSINCGLCVTSFCRDVGERCNATGTCGASGCCNYTCTSDASCTVPEECPENACIGCN